jgi:hypothetical protein
MVQRPSTKWVLLQGLAILGSILLACTIEAWWSDRQDAEEARHLIAALESELKANLSAIKEIAVARNVMSEICANILAATPENLSAEQFDAYLADLLWWERTGFTTAALSALTEGGRLAIIGDSDIAVQIARVSDGIENARIADRSDAKVTRDELIPLLLERGSFAQINNVANKRGHPAGLDWIPSPAVVDEGGRDHRELLNSDKFRGLVVLKNWAQADTLVVYSRLENNIESLLEMLRHQTY